METSVINLIARSLTDNDVRCAIVSPGARNSTLLQSLANSGMDLIPVVDERVAAFVALGMAAESDSPIAIVCTSGSAMLNYAPALAEAFYRRIPIIAITADRPAMWIDRADSQTIRQPGALDSVVKHSYSLPPASGSDALVHSMLLLQEALIEAKKWPRGPVHINVPIDFNADHPSMLPYRPISVVSSDTVISTSRARELGRLLASPRKLLVVAGGGNPSPKINKALSKMSQLPNVAVITEPTSNIHVREAILSGEATLTGADRDTTDRLRPDVVITIGGAIVSARMKKMLRTTQALEHWAVGGMIGYSLPDTFGRLTTLIDMDAESILPLLASAMQPHKAPCDFGNDWRVAYHRGQALLQSAIARAPWSSMRAISYMLTQTPRRWNIHVSNGMTIRIACLVAAIAGPWHRFDCNRGVSGIDGATSTAIGAAISSKTSPTLLITGDMSALYDMASLASGIVPPRFRMAVIDNGGGGIFRFSGATRRLPCRSALLEMEGLEVPLRGLAADCNFDYYEAKSDEELRTVWPRFTSELADRPAILRIITNGVTDADIFNDYYHNSSTK